MRVFLNHKIKPFESGKYQIYKERNASYERRRFHPQKNTVPATRSRFRRGISSSFTSELMSKLPEKEMKPVLSMPSRRRTRMRTVWYAVAAALCGAMFLGTYYLQSVIHPHGESPVAQYGETIETEDIYMDDVLDYAMVSNHEIALYLTDVY